MVNGHKVLVVVPAKDEEATIWHVLEQIKAEYPWMDILVVDDGSNDSTAELAKEKGARVINHDGNLGYVAAIESGRVYALENGYDFLVFIDANGQHRVLDISRILHPLIGNDADQVRGSRELGKYEWKEPLHLKIPRWVCSTLVSLKLRQIITDATSGF